MKIISTNNQQEIMGHWELVNLVNWNEWIEPGETDKPSESNKTTGTSTSIETTYDKVSDQPIIWVREMDESESGLRVLEKVKGTYFDAYLWQTMWNHATN